MKSKFSQIISRILWFFKAVITWLSRRFKVNRGKDKSSIQIDLDYDGEIDIDIEVHDRSNIRDSKEV